MNEPFPNWHLGTPLLIDITNQIVTRITGSRPLHFRKYAWSIRRAPRLALSGPNRAMILWEHWRTACPPAYKPRIY